MKNANIPSDLIERAWGVFTKNWVGFVSLTLVYSIFSSIVGSIGRSENSNSNLVARTDLDWNQISQSAADGARGSGLATLIGFLIAPFLTLWVYQFINDRIENKSEFWSFFRFDWKRYFYLLIYTILESIIVFAVLALSVLAVFLITLFVATASQALAVFAGIILGLLALVLLIYLSIKLSMVEYNIADMGTDPISAIRNSFKMTHGKVSSLLGYILLFTGIGALGFIALLLGLLVALPVIYIANVMIYRALKEKLNNQSVEPVELA